MHISRLITDPNFGRVQLQIIQNRGLRYVVVDRRLSTDLPLVGVYFEKSEELAYAHEEPLEPGSLEKFDDVAGVDRIYDNGDIRIYDVGAARL